MITLGAINHLTIGRTVDFGVYLNDEEGNEVLLPKRYLPQAYEIGDVIKVFIYKDSEDRLIATTETPYAQVGDFAYLEVKSVNRFGAFLGWGLMKDLFVPFKEQKMRMEEGNYYVVYLYIDEDTDRIVASAKIDRYIDKNPVNYQEGDPVDLLVYQYSDLGYKAVVDNRFAGLIYEDEVFRTVAVGDKIKGYIKQVREDGKLDLLIDQPGYGKVAGISRTLLERLEEAGGMLPLCDKTPAEEIYEALGISKKTFKKAVGDLYRQRLIQINEGSIQLVKSESKIK